MHNIEIAVLNPEVVKESEKMMVCAARLTQRGHQIKNLADFMALYNKEYTSKTAKAMTRLPHPTIQKFGVINIVIVGASRRFLAQITRHQNEVKFMSASLQYSDYSGGADFLIPYNVSEMGLDCVNAYIGSCMTAMTEYELAIKAGLDNDSAGYMAPQGLRNILIMSATPYQWKHIISQRICRRNTPETRYVMLKVWTELYKLSPEIFGNAGAFCMKGACEEGKMSCGKPMPSATPEELTKLDFPRLMKKGGVKT